jgi:MFS superfamily sulfate permease-like transporter
MVEPAHFRKLFTFDRGAFLLALLVAILTVGIDAMMGLLVGATISLLIFVQHLSRGQSELTLHKDKKMVARIPHHHLSRYPDTHDVIVYRFAGELTYFNGKSHEEAVKSIKAATVILSLRNLFYVDVDGLEALQEMIENQEAAGRTVILTGASECILPQLQKTSWFAKREKKGSVFGSTTDALKTLGFPLGT